MSCGGRSQNFRLLDGFVGWDEADSEHLSGLAIDDIEGLRLAQTVPDAVPIGEVFTYLYPPRLAHGCGRCDWLLAHGSRLLRRDCCAAIWSPVWSRECDQHLLKNAIAVAARSRRIAVSDDAAKRIWIWERDGEQLVASINLEHLVADPACDNPNRPNQIDRAGALAFTPQGELLIADTKANKIWRFGPAGEFRGELMIALPPMNYQERIYVVAAGDDCSIWLLTRTRDGSFRLWRAARDEKEFKRGLIEQLRKAFKPTGLKAADEEKGFCLEECGPDGLPMTHCFGWDGEPLQDQIAPPPLPARHLSGQLLTRAIDSGIPRCNWHRVRIDANVPPGTMLSVSLASSETEGTLNKTIKSQDEGWEGFAAGVPHKLDWQTGEPRALDFLVDQPPGRYLYLRIRLKGDGAATPSVGRVRLDMPRVTSLDLLPPVYRDNPEAEDFTERFLALFDASIGDLDRAIERAPALLDPEGLPDEALPWLGSFLDVVFDPAWEPDRRRRILQALPNLYRRRGTIAGLVDAINMVFDVKPAIQELAAERSWGSVGKHREDPSQNGFRLGAARLFGKSRARFRLNSSQLGGAPLRSYGNPDHDPLHSQVFRFRVLVPPLGRHSDNARQRLEQLIGSQKPAHTISTIRMGGEGFILGATSAVGVDTVIAPPKPPVLGIAGNVRLNRASVLWHGTHGTHKGVQLGTTTVVGVQTIAT